MSLETYPERIKRWISTACVLDVHEEGHWRWLLKDSAAGVAECSLEANELIERRIDDARREAEIARIRADVRRAWPIVPRGRKC